VPPAATPLAHPDDDADTSAFNAIEVKERETVLQLLHEHRWNVSSVAKLLGISRNTLYRKMHRLHVRLSHAPHDSSTQTDTGA
jgi:transcriptional regulator of acetoin/glycerol metabolism